MRSQTFGHLPDKVIQEKIFVLYVDDRNKPAFIELDHDEKGLTELALLLRSSQIIAVVRGTRIKAKVESVVSIDLGNAGYTHRFDLSESP